MERQLMLIFLVTSILLQECLCNSLTFENTTLLTDLSVASSAEEGDFPVDNEDYKNGENLVYTNSEPCQDMNQYVNVDQCWSDCEDKRVVTLNYQSPNDNFSLRHPHKLTIFGKDEFQAWKNGKFLTKSAGVAFSNATYWTDENNAYVCYPISQYFLSCGDYVAFDEHEVELRDHSRNLWIPAENATYGLGDFLIERDEGEVFYLVCVPPESPSNVTGTTKTVWLVGWVVSAVSLIITFVLSLTITKLNMRNNRSVLAHITMLGLAYFILVLEFIVTKRSSTVCVLWSACRQYFFLSSFFWMNVLACDLCVKLSNMKIRHSLSNLSERRKFWYYGAYAWGVPCLITLATVIVEVAANKRAGLWPGFSEQCWFREDNRLVILLYYYAPIAIIIILNIIFFIITTTNLFKAGQDANRVNKDVNWQMFVISCKLLVVMGILWTMEVVSWLVGGEGDHWNFFDAINSLQGLYIFLIYICKRTHLRLCASKIRVLITKVKWGPNAEDRPSDTGMATFYKASEVSNSTSISGQSSSGTDGNPGQQNPAAAKGSAHG